MVYATNSAHAEGRFALGVETDTTRLGERMPCQVNLRATADEVNVLERQSFEGWH